ncbi:hypothetical protein ABVT39_008800 [Epinephelus coioides]
MAVIDRGIWTPALPLPLKDPSVDENLSVPQSNPRKHLHIHKHGSPSRPVPGCHGTSADHKVSGGGVHPVRSLRSRPKTKPLNIVNTGDNHMKRTATSGGFGMNTASIECSDATGLL